jgi:formylglycine-generating enzyme required for sulfatase activity/TolB-like protein
MKKILFVTTLALLGAFAFSQERIAVFPFEDRNNVFTKDELDSLYREFTNEFRNKTNDSRFTVIPRQDVEKIINMEMKFQLSDYSSKEKTAEMNRVLNAKQILHGVIVKVDNNIRITVSRYTFPDLEVLRGGTTISVANKNQLFDKIPELVQSMMTAMTGGGVSTTVPANMVQVEGGTFQMGNNRSFYDSEKPEHTVTVNSFYMSKYEITRKEWQEVMKRRNIPGGDNLPVTVSWYDAIEYCNERSKKEGLIPCYRGSGDNITCDWNANGYRLPTEAEWEYAAKGGNKDYLIYLYSGSNNAATVAWYIDNAKNKNEVKPVGTKVPNSLGLYDMSGNVSEWCWDWEGNYTNTAKNNPHGPDPANDWGGSRIIRGGSCNSSIREITTTNRGSTWAGWSVGGIRVVRIIHVSNVR